MGTIFSTGEREGKKDKIKLFVTQNANQIIMGLSIRDTMKDCSQDYFQNNKSTGESTGE